MCARSALITRRSPKVSDWCSAIMLARRSMWQSTASKPCRDSSVQSGVVVVVDVLTGVVDVEDCTVVVVVGVVVVDRRVVLVVDVVVELVVGGSVVDVVVVCATVVVVVCGTIVVVVTASVEDIDVVVVVVAW